MTYLVPLIAARRRVQCEYPLSHFDGGHFAGLLGIVDGNYMLPFAVFRSSGTEAHILIVRTCNLTLYAYHAYHAKYICVFSILYIYILFRKFHQLHGYIYDVENRRRSEFIAILKLLIGK